MFLSLAGSLPRTDSDSRLRSDAGDRGCGSAAAAARGLGPAQGNKNHRKGSI